MEDLNKLQELLKAQMETNNALYELVMVLCRPLVPTPPKKPEPRMKLVKK